MDYPLRGGFLYQHTRDRGDAQRIGKLSPGERKRNLSSQIERLIKKFQGRILSFNLRVAREWVRLQSDLRSKARLMPWEIGRAHV